MTFHAIVFQQPRWLVGAWAAIAAYLLVRLSAFISARALRRFSPIADKFYLDRPTFPARRARVMIPSCLLALALALARPGWDPHPMPGVRTGRDVAFVVDVSRSMLAREGATSRLDRARLAITDALAVAKGDRIALVAFAGDAVVKAPLTTDYGFVRLTLSELTPDATPRGGSSIGAGIDAAVQALSREGASDQRDIILMTDGEDHDGAALDAAKRAGAAGIRLIVVGIGDSTHGSPVPADATAAARPLKYNGDQVVSRMNPDALREIAAASPGSTFIDAGTSNLAFDDLYTRLVTAGRHAQVKSESTVRYREGFQIPLAAGLAALVLGAAFTGRTRRA
jgi:Ca-activated chloride channel family protein